MPDPKKNRIQKSGNEALDSYWEDIQKNTNPYPMEADDAHLYIRTEEQKALEEAQDIGLEKHRLEKERIRGSILPYPHIDITPSRDVGTSVPINPRGSYQNWREIPTAPMGNLRRLSEADSIARAVRARFPVPPTKRGQMMQTFQLQQEYMDDVIVHEFNKGQPPRPAYDTINFNREGEPKFGLDDLDHFFERYEEEGEAFPRGVIDWLYDASWDIYENDDGHLREGYPPSFHEGGRGGPNPGSMIPAGAMGNRPVYNINVEIDTLAKIKGIVDESTQKEISKGLLKSIEEAIDDAQHTIFSR